MTKSPVDARHTPTPWHQGKEFKAQVVDKDLFHIADCGIGNASEANAAFIVTAVNCYDDIVEALESALKELKYGADHEAIEKAEQALAKAGA